MTLYRLLSETEQPEPTDIKAIMRPDAVFRPVGDEVPPDVVECLRDCKETLRYFATFYAGPKEMLLKHAAVFAAVEKQEKSLTEARGGDADEIAATDASSREKADIETTPGGVSAGREGADCCRQIQSLAERTTAIEAALCDLQVWQQIAAENEREIRFLSCEAKKECDLLRDIIAECRAALEAAAAYVGKHPPGLCQMLQRAIRSLDVL